jgi:hypothetical protein
MARVNAPDLRQFETAEHFPGTWREAGLMRRLSVCPISRSARLAHGISRIPVIPSKYIYPVSIRDFSGLLFNMENSRKTRVSGLLKLEENCNEY